MAKDDEENGWHEYQRLVLAELERLSECIDKLSDRFSMMEKDMVGIKIKTGIFGSISGFCASFFTNLFQK